MTASAVEIRVRVADYAVATEGTITTIGLGSCIAIVMYDPIARVAGLAHVLLPDESLARDRSNPTKFATTAVPHMLREMLRLGARADRVRAKLVGGASMFASLVTTGGTGNVGHRNVVAAREALAAAGVPIVAEDTGGDHGRSVFLSVLNGQVEVRSLRKGAHVI